MPFLGKTPSQIVDPEVDIDGGTIDGVAIGSVTANAGAFTNLTATGTLTLPDDGISGDDVNGGTISNFASTGIDDNATSTAITIDASENVGIGGSISTAKLYVVGATNDSTQLAFRAQNLATSDVFFVRNDGSMVAGIGSKMTLDGSGNLGIGVSPEAWATYTPIQVQQSSLASFNNGDARLTNNAYYNSGWKYIDSRYATQYLMDASNGIHTWSTAASGTADGAITWSERMRIDNSGNVGIGTPSPTEDLTIAGTKSGLSVTDAILDFGIRNSNGDSKKAQIKSIGTSDVSSELIFSTTATHAFDERMRIDSSGKVGIGTDAPSTTLNVGHANHGVGIAYVSSLPNSAGIYTSSDASHGQAYGSLVVQARAEYSGYGILFRASNLNRMRIDGTGQIFLGDATGTGYYGSSAVGSKVVINYTSSSTDTNVTPKGLVIRNDDTTANNVSQLVFGTINSNNTPIGTAAIYSVNNARTSSFSSADIGFATASSNGVLTERMRIADDGEVTVQGILRTTKAVAVGASTTTTLMSFNQAGGYHFVVAGSIKIHWADLGYPSGAGYAEYHLTAQATTFGGFNGAPIFTQIGQQQNLNGLSAPTFGVTYSKTGSVADGTVNVNITTPANFSSTVYCVFEGYAFGTRT